MNYAEARAGGMKARLSSLTAAHFRPLLSSLAMKDPVYIGRVLRTMQPLNLDTADVLYVGELDPVQMVRNE